MITEEQIRHVRRGLGAFDGPVLSLYAALAADGHERAAIETRARQTLRALSVPRRIARRALSALRDASRGARTVAIFCNQTELQDIELAADLPVIHPRTGYFDARWGRAYVAPFLLALDRFPRYAVSYIDRDHWRMFELFLGDIAEIDFAERAPVPPNDERSQNPSPAALQMWYRLNAQRLEQRMWQRSIGSLVVMGPDRRVSEFIPRLHVKTQRAILAQMPGLSRPGAHPAEVLGRVGPVLREIEVRRQRALVDQAADTGFTGIESSVRATMRGEVECLLVPWMSDEHAYVDPRSGDIAGRPDARHVHRYPLRDVVADLALRGQTRLEFVEDGQQRDRLHELGGLAALRQMPTTAMPAIARPH